MVFHKVWKGGGGGGGVYTKGMAKGILYDIGYLLCTQQGMYKADTGYSTSYYQSNSLFF